MVNASLVVLSCLFFFIPCTLTGYWIMLVFQILISILTGIMSPLVWSMYADVSDYAEWEFKTASTGLIFSSSSMAQKFGGAIGGAAVLWLLSGFGYITDPELLSQGNVIQPEAALSCLRWLMSFIPACVALLSMLIVWFYPLTTERINEINAKLKNVRAIEE
jgi:GPH family glycoside/pentoside/hexuronide:cation symporter